MDRELNLALDCDEEEDINDARDEEYDRADEEEAEDGDLWLDDDGWTLDDTKQLRLQYQERIRLGDYDVAQEISEILARHGEAVT